MVEQLKFRGVHIGYFLDDNGVYDKRVAEFAKYDDQENSAAELSGLLRELINEARNIPNGIAAVWHPDLKLDPIRQASPLPVVPIVAQEIHHAEMLLDEILQSKNSSQSVSTKE